MNEKENIAVTISADSKPAYAGATLAFSFTNLSFLFWAALLGFLGENASFTIGIIQLGVLAIYTIGAVLLLKSGNAFEGNVFLIFAGFFAGVGGLTNVSGAIAANLGWGFCITAPGICWILCGVFLLAVLPAVRTSPKAGFIFYIFGGIGLIVMGLTTLELIPAAWNTVAAWSFFVAGVCGLFVTVSVMNDFCGVKNFPPLGKPFFK